MKMNKSYRSEAGLHVKKKKNMKHGMLSIGAHGNAKTASERGKTIYLGSSNRGTSNLMGVTK